MATKTRTAASVATRLATVLTHDGGLYGGAQWELVRVAPAGPYGHQVIISDVTEEAEYVITVQRRSTAPAIVADVSDVPDAEPPF